MGRFRSDAKMFICQTCKIEKLGQPTQKWCSTKCRKSGLGIGAQYPGLPTATTGTISELRVSADLLGKKYEVFRALSPSCSCDLLAIKDGKHYSIEVRTGYENKNGVILTCKLNVRAQIFAVVLPDRIIYNPTM